MANETTFCLVFEANTGCAFVRPSGFGCYGWQDDPERTVFPTREEAEDAATRWNTRRDRQED